MEVVLCLFPHPESPSIPGIKLHPCLVMGRFHHNNRCYAVVVYGTSKMHKRHENRSVLCVRPEHRIEWPLADSDVITYFIGTDVAVLPSATSEFFPVKGIGKIDERAVSALEFQEFNCTARRSIKKLMERFMATGKIGYASDL